MRRLLTSRCKCSEGKCYQQFAEEHVFRFLKLFESASKLEQDTILHLAWSDAGRSKNAHRREFFFLDQFMRRACFEQLVGVSSHRIDRIGAADLRFGRHERPSPLTASIDAFCLLLYNSVAEPLPNRCLLNMQKKIAACVYLQKMLLAKDQSLSGWFGLGQHGERLRLKSKTRTTPPILISRLQSLRITLKSWQTFCRPMRPSCLP